MTPRTPITDLDLMLAADGELTLEGELTAEARAIRDGVGQLGELVRGHWDLQAETVPALDSVWERIEARLDNTDTLRTLHRGGIVVEDRTDAVREPAIQPPPAPIPASWFASYRGHLLTAVVSAGVVAAISLWAKPRPEGQGPMAAARDVAEPAPMRPVAAPLATEVESIDLPIGTGTVLRLVDEDGAATVLWIDPSQVEGL